MRSYIGNNNLPTPLFFVNGKETSSDIVNSLNAENIKNIKVLREPDEIKKYGSKGRKGVVLIATEYQKKTSK